MTWKPNVLFLFAGLVGLSGIGLQAETGANFRDENLVAWCIVPFDAKMRSPAERASMLESLGMSRCAYDWRAEHVPSFEQEIVEYQSHGIEFFAFWGSHDLAFALFEKYDLHPQIWMTCRGETGETQDEKVEMTVAKLAPLAKRVAGFGSRLGLYNHGGWGGEPANLVAVCEALHAKGFPNVGIVYNFHHGHDQIEDWEASFALMQPHLLCLNLNGMVREGDVLGRKILPLGQGDAELGMLRVVVESGYDGPIGILDHRPETDSAETLAENLAGMAQLRQEIGISPAD